MSEKTEHNPTYEFIKNHFGEEVANLAALSPTLMENMSKLIARGCQFEFGCNETNTYYMQDSDKIIINENIQSDPNDIISALAHETAHAVLSSTPGFYYNSDYEKIFHNPNELSKNDYIDACVKEALNEEGAALLTSCIVAVEIKKAGGPSILNGDIYQMEEVIDIIKDYFNGNESFDATAEKLGVIFGEHFKTVDQNGNAIGYEAYYKKFFEKFWDNNLSENEPNVKPAEPSNNEKNHGPMQGSKDPEIEKLLAELNVNDQFGNTTDISNC